MWGRVSKGEMEVGILIVLLSAGEGKGENSVKPGRRQYHASVVCDGYSYFAYSHVQYY